ncbi:LysE family translocator [Oerskovia jenensis]|uniref:LysE family translocator n=1 Tax=Oerskovia jenensis TaxID=162169 RepID=UPI0036DA0772
MSTTQALLSFSFVALLLTIMPGLDTALVLRTSIVHGRRHAWVAASGIGAGCLVWGVGAAVGAAALLAASHTAYRVLTFAGALYLVTFGARLLWTSLRGTPPADLAVDVTRSVSSPRSLATTFAAGAGTNLLNPKIGVFYVATIPQFIPEGSSHLLMGVLLAVVHNLIGLLWFVGIIAGTRWAARWLGGPSVARVTDRVTGVVLVAFGIRLAASAR